MIAHAINDMKSLVTESKKVAKQYCNRNRLPNISVGQDDGTSPSGSIAFFSKYKVKIFMCDRYFYWVEKQPYEIKVWLLFTSVAHELKHYEQFLYQRNKGISTDKMKLDETEAYNFGRLFGDTRLHSLTTQEINPLVESIITGAGLGIGLFGVKRLFNGRRNPMTTEVISSFEEDLILSAYWRPPFPDEKFSHIHSEKLVRLGIFKKRDNEFTLTAFGKRLAKQIMINRKIKKPNKRTRFGRSHSNLRGIYNL